jgi:site-specific recombinase XerD
MSTLVPEFLVYARVELQFADQSLLKYKDCFRQIQRMIGDRDVLSYSKDDVMQLKSRMLEKGHSVSRQVSILSALKRLLAYCRKQRNLPTLDPTEILVPKRPRRDVVFLTPAEVERFAAAINLTNLDGSLCWPALRFRALVEALLGSAMRIGELLSLDRTSLDLVNREAKIVGKGNKERVAFFTQRAVYWLQQYLATRQDGHPALFVCQGGRSRLKRDDIWRPFNRYRKVSGINKPVTPHLLRHTAATQLLFNGCPIGHIKEILGHERLETTCRYYLGLDRRAAKQAHERYLKYTPADEEAVPRPAEFLAWRIAPARCSGRC